MSVYELSRDQMVMLKQNILMERDASVSWNELADADELVSDEEAQSIYGNTDFSSDDFAS